MIDACVVPCPVPCYGSCVLFSRTPPRRGGRPTSRSAPERTDATLRRSNARDGATRKTRPRTIVPPRGED